MRSPTSRALTVLGLVFGLGSVTFGAPVIQITSPADQDYVNPTAGAPDLVDVTYQVTGNTCTGFRSTYAITPYVNGVAVSCAGNGCGCDGTTESCNNVTKTLTLDGNAFSSCLNTIRLEMNPRPFCGPLCFSPCSSQILSQTVEVWQDKYRDCTEPKGCNRSTVGQPVDVATGKMYHEMRDMRIDGPLPIQFVRRYDSQSTYNGPMSFGWQHNFLVRLESAGTGQRVLVDREARSVYFAQTTGGAWRQNRFDHLVLSQPGSPPWRVTGPGPIQWDFDAGGRLTSITDRNSNTLTLSYSGSDLTSVADAFGRALSFTYDGASRVQTISAGGRTVTYTYNVTTGNLDRVDYSDGSFVTYEYTDPNDIHNLTAARDSYGNLIEGHTYFADDRVQQSQSDGGNNAFTLSYDSATQTTVTNSRAVSTVYTHDAFAGVVVQSNGPGCASCGGGGTSATLTYDTFLNLTSVTDGRGVVTEMTHDGNGNVLTRTEAKGTHLERVWTSTYHPTFNVPATVSIPSVGSCGNPDKVVTSTYDGATGDRLSEQVTGCNGNVPFTHTTTWTYDSHGQIRTVDGPRTDVSDVTTLDYYPGADADVNRRGRLQRVTNALGQQTDYGDYDLFGSVGTVTDVNGVVTDYLHDGKSRPTEVRVKGATTLEDIVTEYHYDLEGNLDFSRLPNCVDMGMACAFSLDYVFDTVNRLTEIRDAAGNKIINTYDTEGNRTREEYRDGADVVHKLTNFSYDDHNRLQYVYFNAIVPENPGSVFYKFTYFDDGTPETETDPEGHLTTFDHDELKRLETVTETVAPGTLTVSYGYDRHDSLTSIIDPNGLQTTYERGDLGWMLSTVSPDTGTTANGYDPAGNLASSTNANGISSTRTYDALNRLTAVTYPDSSLNVGYTYDSVSVSFGVGRRTGMTDPSGASVFHYSRRGLFSREDKTIESTTYTTEYGYDKSGNLVWLKYPADDPSTRQGQADFTYDATDRVATITAQVSGAPATVANGLAYKPFGPRTQATFGNLLTDSRSFGTRYEPASWTLGSLLSYDHTFDDDLNLTARTDNLDGANNRTFGYDEIHRLSTAAGPWGTGTGCPGSVTYTYDPNGNRLCKGEGLPATTYAYTAATNRLASSAGGHVAAYSYDSNGNITGDGTMTYEYNQADRLASIDSGATATYTYDGDGRRVIKTAGGTTTYFFYDPTARLLAETVPSEGSGKEYVYLLDEPIGRVDWSIDELGLGNVLRVDKSPPDVRLDWTLFPAGSNTYSVRRKTVVDPDDKTFDGSTVIASQDDPAQTHDDPVLSDGDLYNYRVFTRTLSETLSFYHADYFGTPIAMTDVAAGLVWKAEHLPFGGIDSLAVSTATNDVRLPGQYFDSETGLHQNFFRDYSADTGRYVEPDPIGLFGGANIYAYTDNRPTTYFDPSGLDAASPWDLGWEWLTGWGPRQHSFGPGDPFTSLLQQHSHIQSVRNAANSELQQRCRDCNSAPFGDVEDYSLAGWQGVPKYFRDYSTLLTGGLTGNLAVTFLGSYNLKYDVDEIDCCNGTASVGFHVDNNSTINSATHWPVIGYHPWWERNIGQPLNSLFQSGPMSETTQNIDWTESVTFTGNPCCR